MSGQSRSGSSKANNPRVLRRDRFVCQYCFDLADSVDHIIPRSISRDDTMGNKVACCTECNRIAGNLAFNSFAEKKAFILKVKAKRVYLPLIES